MERKTKLDGTSWVSLFSSMDTGCYRQELPKKQRLLVRAAHTALFLLSAVLFLLAASRPFAGSYSWPVVLPEAFALACAFRLLAALIMYWSIDCEASAADHNRSSFALKRAALWAAVFQGLACVGAGGYMYAVGAPSREGVLSSCLFLGSALPMALMSLLERRIPYTRVEDPAASGD